MAAGERIGVMNCWSCDHEVPVKKTSTGNTSAPCTWCDFHHYARPGTKHLENFMKDVRLDKAAPAAPSSPPAKDDPAPTVTKRRYNVG